MSRSWGHEVRHLTEPELAALERQNRRGAEIFGREDYDYDVTCKMPKCRDRATHEVRYRYVTGRAGRTSWAAKNACTSHAERFAAKHEIEIADAPPRQHAIQQAIGQAFGVNGEDVVFCHATCGESAPATAGTETGDA